MNEQPSTPTPADTWPPAHCPQWCAREHDRDDHPEDRVHRSEPVVVSVVRRSDFLSSGSETVDLLVFNSLEASSSTSWCSVVAAADFQPQLHLTSESAERLQGALAQVLGELAEQR